MTAVAELLEKAADLIEIGGHVKHALRAENGNGGYSYCAIGALNCAFKANNAQFGQFDMAVKAIANQVGIRDGFEVVNWNNAPERTGAEVIDAMRHAAKNLRNGE